jgi:SAM-dependent methyltransferase
MVENDASKESLLKMSALFSALLRGRLSARKGYNGTAKDRHLQRIRECELQLARSFMLESSTVLEVGAGAGWQAQALAEMGFQVEAIDVEENRYRDNQVWSVAEYDGAHIPFPDNHFDVVFSSNVLEHIAEIKVFQAEIQRVLKPDGMAIHILPTGSWRFWTSLTYYPYLIKAVIKIVANGLLPKVESSLDRKATEATKERKHSWRRILKLLCGPPRHGETGNAISELYSFSRFSWVPFFCRTGWLVRSWFPTRLFYTGHSLFGSLLSMQVRHQMSFVLGSSCNIYILKVAYKNNGAS